jgi:hypothetical protein
MKYTAYFSFIAISILFFNCKKEQKYTSFYPGQVWEDNNGAHINAHGGGILLHNGIYYWYGEHKVSTHIGNSAQVGVHVYSSTDLYNWKDEGIALKVAENDTLHDITKGCILERPKVIFNEKTGTFVMWFHLELKNASYASARSGIAISTSPTGPFTYLKSVRPNQGQWPENVLEVHKNPIDTTITKSLYSGGSLPNHPDSLNLLGRDFSVGQMARDMNLFVDDNGKAYHIFASEENSTIHIAELSDDYQGYSGKYKRFFIGRFMEAPALFKRKGKYFFIASGCTGWAPNAARSAVAPSIWGPWTELGNPCIGPEADLTFRSQSTYVLPVPGSNEDFIFMADRWTPENPIDGTYIWLPVKFDQGKPEIEWLDSWSY